MVERSKAEEGLSDDPVWYRDAVFYELRVRSFYDSNGDGIGDLPGLTQKLDYLQDLGVTTLWLLPICASPMRDDGYDISDYMGLQPDVGTLDDFRELVEQAHRRGLRILTELVLNHTSDRHPWFQRARRAAAGSVERNFYVWSDQPDKYSAARIIFKDFETSNWAWDPLAKSYYWHRFYSHQPDLNFANPAVKKAMSDVVDFWFGFGVDGLRLDAVPYLFEAEGTSSENLPETHAYLKELRRHIDSKFRNRVLLAEANQWPEDAARYFGDGDECQMNFHFPIMPRLFMAIDLEDRFPILDILDQTPAPPDGCQWALFLRNHDELTLEMVTDEERDHMYRAYAHDPAMRINLGIRRRLAPLVGNSRRRMELMNGLLASLPGTPVLYYGDEIGMGDNVFLGDRDGVRTPMQWSADRNAGFSRANPQRLVLPVNIDPEYHYESVNVEAQQNNTSSLLWWTKRLLALRRRYLAFGRGTLESLTPENHRVLAFIRRYEDETILVVANLSRFVQYVELDLSRMKGAIPVELFGRTEFPPIGDLPYLLTIGGHAFYWFSLEKRVATREREREDAYEPPVIEFSGSLGAFVRSPARIRIESVLPEYLASRSWYEPGGRDLEQVKLADHIPPANDCRMDLLILRAYYAEGEAEQYVMPMLVEWGPAAAEVLQRAPNSVIAQLREPKRPDPEGVLVDAVADGRFAAEWLEMMVQHAPQRGIVGNLAAFCDEGVTAQNPDGVPLDARMLRSHRGRIALAFQDSYYLKLARRIGEGTSPEVEVGRFLKSHAPDAPTPRLLGNLEYSRGREEPMTLATLHVWVPHEVTAWTHVLQDLGRYFERALSGQVEWPDGADGSFAQLAFDPLPPAVETLLGPSILSARLIAATVAKLHVALASAGDDAAFTPEPYSGLDRRSMYQSMRNVAGRALRRLKSLAPRLSEPVQIAAHRVLAQEEAIHAVCEPLLGVKLTGCRIRCHGDLRLEKLLFTGRDFIIVDFDGDCTKPLADRRRKRPPLRDVATLVRSLEEVAACSLADSSLVRDPDRPTLEPWAALWARGTGAELLRTYLAELGNARFLGTSSDENKLLFGILRLEVALQEIDRRLERLDGSPHAEAMLTAALDALSGLLG